MVPFADDCLISKPPISLTIHSARNSIRPKNFLIALWKVISEPPRFRSPWRLLAADASNTTFVRAMASWPAAPGKLDETPRGHHRYGSPFSDWTFGAHVRREPSARSIRAWNDHRIRCVDFAFSHCG